MKTFATEPRQEPKRRVDCALCGGSGFARSWDCGGYSFVRCASCGLVQQNPQPEPDFVAARYDESYLAYEEGMQFAYRDLELLALADLGILDLPPRRVLDIGCATGSLLDALRERGWAPQGVEICASAAEYGRRRFGLPIHAGDLESAAFGPGSFDLAHASHLIEHLNDPASFLDEVARVLAPGGLLALTTPNADGLQARLLGARWRSAIYDHLYLFSLGTLKLLLESKGFAVLRSVTWGGWARGQRPAFLKSPLDRWAKRLGFGDVCAVLARRSAAGGP